MAPGTCWFARSQVAAALSAMASAKHAAVNPLRGEEVAADAGRALSRAMDALEAAAVAAPLHATSVI